MRSKYINQGRRPLRLGLPLSDTTLLYTHTGAAADCCVAWVEPLEAQDALAQARCRRDVGEMWARCRGAIGEISSWSSTWRGVGVRVRVRVSVGARAHRSEGSA